MIVPEKYIVNIPGEKCRLLYKLINAQRLSFDNISVDKCSAIID
jgi:hypothetical protein